MCPAMSYHAAPRQAVSRLPSLVVPQPDRVPPRLALPHLAGTCYACRAVYCLAASGCAMPSYATPRLLCPPCIAVPSYATSGLAPPRLPCIALQIQVRALPPTGLACHVLPCRAPTRHILHCLASHVVPCLVASSHSTPAMNCRAPSCLTEPSHVSPYPACHVLPCCVALCRAAPRLAKPAVDCLAEPRRATPACRVSPC